MKVIPVVPMAKPRMTASDKWRKRPVVLRYRMYKDELRPFNVELPDVCKVIFYLPMPPSWSAKKALAHVGQAHKCKPDIDNLAKGLLDAIFEEDSHIWSVWFEKRWALKGSINITPI